MYRPPVELVYGQLKTKIEGETITAVQSYNINVDKDELIKALEYDRNQYSVGFDDGFAHSEKSITRCKDCQHCALEFKEQRFGEPSQYIRVCLLHDHETTLDDYCSFGVRKEDLL